MGVTPVCRAISIAAWVPPAAIWASPSVRESAATQLAWLVVVGQAVTARSTAGQAVPAAPAPGLEQVSGG
jgi:hypothetical protein